VLNKLELYSLIEQVLLS